MALIPRASFLKQFELMIAANIFGAPEAARGADPAKEIMRMILASTSGGN